MKVVLGLFFFLFFKSSFCLAHIPNPSQIFRFQPQMARNRGAFSIKSSGIASQSDSKTRIPIEIHWYSPGEYTVDVGPLPKSFFYSETPKPLSWKLSRKAKECALKTETSIFACAEGSFWSQLELSGQPESAIKSVAEAGFINADETLFTETNGRALGAIPAFERQPPGPQNPLPPGLESSNGNFRKARVRISQGYNGDTPVAVLEVRGNNFFEGKSIQDEAFPIIHLDPSFLVPLLARWKTTDDQIITYRATADSEIRRKQSRFTHLLSKELAIFEGPNPLAVFTRQLLETYPKPPAKQGFPKPTGGQVKNYFAQLTPEGQAFLSALLLSH